MNIASLLPAFLVGAALCVGSGTAQVEWREVEPSARWGHAMVYDAARGRLVLFGGATAQVDLAPFGRLLGKTWESTGMAWSVQSSTGPAPRVFHDMVYDTTRQRVVLFGGEGEDGELLADTWAWDGSAWTELLPATTPPVRRDHTIAYDSARDRVVLFGGTGTAGLLQDTWEWNGVDWMQLSPAISPSVREGHSMAFDAARGVVVLHGRDTPGFPLVGETWEWDGSEWTLRHQGQLVDRHHDLDYDSLRGRVVLVGGFTGNNISHFVYEWDGQDWAFAGQLPNNTDRDGIFHHAMSFDSGRGRMILFGGLAERPNREVEVVADAWERQGDTWVHLGGTPDPRAYAAMAYDEIRQQTILFSGAFRHAGSVDTWAWDGAAWSPMEPPGLGASDYYAMVYDAARQRVMAYGEESTREWDGVEWVERFPANTPTADFRCALAFDRLRQRAVLFGGARTPPRVPFDETWQWDGSDWQRLFPAVAPSARWDAAMTYDAARDRVVLFGGNTAPTGWAGSDETWEWDGETWTERFPTNRPPARHGHAMAYDPIRQRVIMSAGFGQHPTEPFGEELLADTWEWDGEDWIERPTPAEFNRAAHAMAFDLARGEAVVFGGQFSTAIWSYRATDPASTTSFGAGCPGSAGTPNLAPVLGQRPWLGEAVSLQLTGLPLASSPLLLIGLSNEAWGQLSLPQPLGPFGLPGCTAYTSADLAIPLTNSAGTAVWTLQVPNDLAFLGLALYAQGLVPDGGVNAFGATASNGVGLVLGGK